MFNRKVILFVLLVLSPFAVQAEDASAPMFARVFFAEVEPNAQRDYEAVLKKFAAAHQKLNTGRHYLTSTQVAGSPTTYTFARVFSSFASMDEEPINVMVDAYGAEETMEIVKAMNGRVEAQRSGIWVRRLDLSPAQPKDAEPAALINWLQVKIKPYGNAAYEEYLMKVAEATTQVVPQFPFVVWSPGPGGDNVYAFANPIASWAAMDQGGGMSVPARLEEAFGKREAKRLLELRESLVESQETFMSRPRPELSYLPGE